MSYRLLIQEDGEGQYIELPDQLLEELKWSEGDELLWNIDEDGKISLRKRETDDSSNET